MDDPAVFVCMADLCRVGVPTHRIFLEEVVGEYTHPTAESRGERKLTEEIAG